MTMSSDDSDLSVSFSLAVRYIFPMLFSIGSIETGFVKKSLQPAAKASALSDSKAKAVSAMMGMFLSSWRIIRVGFQTVHFRHFYIHKN